MNLEVQEQILKYSSAFTSVKLSLTETTPERPNLVLFVALSSEDQSQFYHWRFSSLRITI